MKQPGLLPTKEGISTRPLAWDRGRWLLITGQYAPYVCSTGNPESNMRTNGAVPSGAYGRKKARFGLVQRGQLACGMLACALVTSHTQHCANGDAILVTDDQ
jgi:hypothetical protein